MCFFIIIDEIYVTAITYFCIELTDGAALIRRTLPTLPRTILTLKERKTPLIGKRI